MKTLERKLEENQELLIRILDWRLPITQQLENFEELEHINTHEKLGLLNIDTKTYLLTKDGLKHRLPNGEIKICITKEDAHAWVKRVHEHKEPYLSIEKMSTQVCRGPHWWSTTK